MDLGEKIVEARKKKGLTQKELGALLHVSDKVISKWETGKALPDLDMFKELTKILDINVDEFFEKVQIKSSSSKLNFDAAILNYCKFFSINIFVLILGIIIYESGYKIAIGNTYFNTIVYEVFKLIKDLICIICIVSQIVLFINFLLSQKKNVSLYYRRNLIILLISSGIFLVIFIITIGLGNYLYI